MGAALNEVVSPMSGPTFFKQNFSRNREGSVSIIFGISIVVLLGMVGLAVDTSRYYNYASIMQQALDAAALAGAKELPNDQLNDTDIIATAESYFRSTMLDAGIKSIGIANPNVHIDRAANAVEVTAQARLPTLFANVISHSGIVTVNRTSRVVYDLTKVELSMVLDITGSMRGTKIAALKDAATDVIDILINPSSPVLTRVAVVPYSAAVNTGTYRDIASGGDSLDGCVMERLFPANLDTDVPTGGSNNYAVNGQLNSASNAHYSCPAATILPLTKDPAAIKGAIAALVAGGSTAGHIGLAWGWNMISEKWAGIFTGTKAPGPNSDPNIKKAVLLMTDGDFNTAYTAGTPDADQKAESTARTLALCANIKAENIRVFTVAFMAPPAAETLLRSCASAPGDYFDASNSTQLHDAFTSIAKKLSTLRIAG